VGERPKSTDLKSKNSKKMDWGRYKKCADWLLGGLNIYINKSG